LLRIRGLAEAALLLGAVIGVRVVLDLWLATPGSVIAYDDPWLQAVAVWAAMFRWLAAALLLVAGARWILGVSLCDGGAIAALALAGIWIGPVVVFLVPGVVPFYVVAIAVAVAACAVFAAWLCLRAGPFRIAAFAIAAALVVAVDATWEIGHAWLADFAGLAVRGALLPGMTPPERAVYGMVPLVVVAVCLVMLAGRNDEGCPRRALMQFFGPAFGGFAALGVAWGFLFASQQAGYGLDVLHPPVLYAPALALLALWLAGLAAVLVARRQRRFTDTTPAVDCVALLVLAALAGAPIGEHFLAFIALLAALGLFVAWSLGRPRLPVWTAPLLAGLAAVLLYAAGYAVAPGVPVMAVLANGLALAGMFGVGASLGVIALLEAGPSAGRRWSDQIWLFNLMAAFGIVFLASGVTDAMVWFGLIVSWAALALVALGLHAAEPGQRLMIHALPFAWALAILAILGLLAQSMAGT
jgi:hypothetical protein